MKYITVVIAYRDDQQQPSFYANMPVLDGIVTGVQFDDALEENQKLEEEIESIKREGRL